MLLPLGGQVQLLSCPEKRRKKKNALRLKLNLENHSSYIRKSYFFCLGDVFFQHGTQPRAFIQGVLQRL